MPEPVRNQVHSEASFFDLLHALQDAHARELCDLRSALLKAHGQGRLTGMTSPLPIPTVMKEEDETVPVTEAKEPANSPRSSPRFSPSTCHRIEEEEISSQMERKASIHTDAFIEPLRSHIRFDQQMKQMDEGGARVSLASSQAPRLHVQELKARLSHCEKERVSFISTASISSSASAFSKAKIIKSVVSAAKLTTARTTKLTDSVRDMLSADTGDLNFDERSTELFAYGELFGSAITLLNIIQMGVSLDHYTDWEGWFIIDCIFAAAFLIELIVKCMASGVAEYLQGPNRWWNIFDALIVCLALMEVIVILLAGQSGMQVNLSTFRIIRLLRLTRLVRMLEQPFFKELRIMCMGIYHGGRTLLWSWVFILAPLYPVAVFLRTTLGEVENDERVRRNFQSVPWSWFTLFRCVMGDCADERGAPIFLLIGDQGWWFRILYCVTTVVVVFGVFNVIVSIFVENTMDAAKSNQALQRRRRLADGKSTALLTRRLVNLFRRQCVKKRMSQLSRGESPMQGQAEDWAITPEMFEHVLQLPETHDVLDELDVSQEDRYELFEILDADGSGTLELHELVNGIMKLRGAARRSDVVAIRLVLACVQDHMFAMHADLLQMNSLMAGMAGEDGSASGSPSLHEIHGRRMSIKKRISRYSEVHPRYSEKTSRVPVFHSNSADSAEDSL